MNSALSELYTNYNASGFQLISVSEDRNRELWLQAIKEDKLSWPPGSNLNTADGEVFRTYGVQATPGNFLINEEGIIVAKNLRGEELEKTIKEYLTD